MIVGLVIGLLLGAAIAWLVLRAQYASRVTTLDDARASLGTTLKALAADALATNNQSFLELAKAQLEQQQQQTTQELEQRRQAVEHLVTPIAKSLEKVDGKLQQLELERTRAYSELTVQVRQLAETQSQLRSETGNLVSALRDRPNVRGRWGEIQLRRVVEMAGMLEHCDFETQRHVVTDAKVACQAYIEALEASDDELRAAKLRDHARQVRDHVTRLAAKSYWSQFDRAPDFVVLFIPGENFLNA